MSEENVVLCASSAYEQKYFFNESFSGLPAGVRDELKIMCVLFTEDVGGILVMEYEPDGTLIFRTEADDGDLLYDEIGSGLKIKRLLTERRELLSGLELYYKAVVLGLDVTEETME